MPVPSPARFAWLLHAGCCPPLRANPPSCAAAPCPSLPQLLLGSGLTPEQRELADTILESGNTLLGILGDILDFSKVSR